MNVPHSPCGTETWYTLLNQGHQGNVVEDSPSCICITFQTPTHSQVNQINGPRALDRENDSLLPISAFLSDDQVETLT